MTNIEAMKLALDFIERTSTYLPIAFDEEGIAIHAALRHAISEAEQAEQEPVAWGWADKNGDIEDCISNAAHCGVPSDNFTIPLYTAPPQREWVSLTDDELRELAKQNVGKPNGILARAIEAKLKEKNNGAA